MGSYLSSPVEEKRGSGSQKRPLDESNESQGDAFSEQNLETPKRKKLKCTAKYIYQTLFVSGENSDIKIVALGRSWALHKVYLRQSGYFACMFNGSWKESNLDTIAMDIPDTNVDEEALHVAFGSLYRDDVFIKPAQIVSILAAATLLQLDGLIHQAADTMKETISSKTVCSYHNAAVMYGLTDVIKKCTDWLEKNLMTCQTTSLLRDLSHELMEQLITSHQLFVMQVEMDIYTMLKKWMFLKLVPSWTGSSKRVSSEADIYYKKHVEGLQTSFLESDRGANYASVFRCIRFQHVINDLPSAKLLQSDKIIPRTWLLPFYQMQWHYMLRIEQGLDKGPQDVSTEDFQRHSMRCGRVLSKDGEFCWRWTGFNYGIDLLVTFTKRLLIFKRNTHSQSCTSFVSLSSKRTIMFHVIVASFDKFGQTLYKSSKVQTLTLGKDEEQVIMGVDRHVLFPLHISLNVLYYTPSEEIPMPVLALPSCGREMGNNIQLDLQSASVHGGEETDLPVVEEQSQKLADVNLVAS